VDYVHVCVYVHIYICVCVCVCKCVCFNVEQIPFRIWVLYSLMINSKSEETNQTWFIFTLPLFFFYFYEKQKNANFIQISRAYVLQTCTRKLKKKSGYIFFNVFEKCWVQIWKQTILNFLWSWFIQAAVGLRPQIRI